MGSAHFLVAAGMRIAKRLAQIRTDEIEPSPEATQHAFHDAASRCLYGVDLNPMAVELAKVAIWLECHVPGQPLTFLDHHLKTGNALLGVGFDPDLTAWHRTAKTAADQKGVPDAALKSLAGDDKPHARLLRDLNKQRRGGGGQLRLGAGTHHDRLDHLADRARQLDELPDDSPDALAAKQQAWDAAQHDPELARQRLRADAWMASWTFPKTKDASAPLTDDDPLAHDQLPWDVYYDTFLDDDLQLDQPGVRAVNEEAQRLAFFHWHLEFPDIATAGGFSCLLGNPPWERLTPSEQEWFSSVGMEEVAHDRRASSRRMKIAALKHSEDSVERNAFRAYESYLRGIEMLSEFARMSGRYERVWARDLNLYALFALNFRDFSAGRAGILIPTAAVTDYGMKDFFAGLVAHKRLVAAYDFENKGKRLFPEVHASFRFVTLITTPGAADAARFAFMLHDPTELDDADRSYTLTPEQIALVNPNTRTAPVFPTSRDAEITTTIYERHPVLIHHGRDDGNPWGISFMRMFDMSNDSGLFHTADQLRAAGWTLEGNIFERDDERMLPLYEAKMFHHFNHRWVTYIDDTTSRDGTPEQLSDPTFEATPRHWIAGTAVAEKLATKGWDHDVLLSWRDICRATDRRSCITTFLPRSAANNKCLLALPGDGVRGAVVLLSVWSSFACDFIVRQKTSGTQLLYYTFEQIPVMRPSELGVSAPWDATTLIADWVAARTAALVATTEAMAAALCLAEPRGWDAAQRDLWRSELDAAMFHLYGYSRNEVAYVMDTFPIVARKDRQSEGLADDDPNWRTKRLILDKYDELAEHARAGTTYVSPKPPPPLPAKLRLIDDRRDG